MIAGGDERNAEDEVSQAAAIKGLSQVTKPAMM